MLSKELGGPMAQRSLPSLILKVTAQPDESDGELLGKFVRERDHAAFGELVRRHGAMVWSVCRKALGDGPDAEDAFQATFFVLVRKAASVSPREMVGSWLYGVAWRTAHHARVRLARLHARRRELPDVSAPQSPQALGDETVGVVHAELAGLPDRYRVAVVLCELEGRTIAEAARLLGVAVGTVASRLARGRAMLAERLRRRGWCAGVVLGFAGSLPDAVAARALVLVPSSSVAVEVSQSVAELTDGVVRAMWRAKLTAVTQIILGIGVLTGVVWAATASNARQPAPPDPPPDRSNPFAGVMNPPGAKSWMESLWDDMLRDEPAATRAVLAYLRYIPKDHQISFLKGKLHPLKVDKADAKKWIAALANEDDWKAAYQKLEYFDPRLALAPDEAMENAMTLPARRRLAAILIGSNNPNRFHSDGNNWTIRVKKATDGTFTLEVSELFAGGFPPQSQVFTLVQKVADLRVRSWMRLTRGVLILEHLGTPEALSILKDVATGHPDALPTEVAKKAVASLTQPPP
jgi:RNA polymerase sigma factor (sigma-70 family)